MRRRENNKNLIFASALLAGTIIGAGVFSLPYVVSKIGIALGFFCFVLFAIVYYCLHLMYVKIALLHKEKHNFAYFAEQHLSPRAGIWASITIVGGMVLSLAVYLVLAPSFIHLFLGLEGLPAALLFWGLGSIFIFVELSMLGIAEMLGVAGILGAILVIMGAGSTISASIALSPASSSWTIFLLPFGPLLFSFSGRAAIVTMVEEHRAAARRNEGFSIAKAILLGTSIPLVAYLVFTFAFLRINPTPSVDPIRDLAALPETLLIALGIMGFLALWTSYFMIGLNVKNLLEEDLKIPRLWSELLVLLVPILLYISGIATFIELVAFTGSIFLAFEGMFITRMWQNAFSRSPFRAASFLLYFIFIAALFYEVVYVIL